jgi:hypothetical protein
MEKSHKIWNENHPDNPIKKGDGYLIHHKDGDHNNDDPDNHQKMTRGEHQALHATGVIFTKQRRNKIALSRIGKSSWNKGLSKETDPRIIYTGGFSGKTHSKKTKLRMTKARIGKIQSKETRQKRKETMLGKNLGKLHSEATKAKMRKSQRLAWKRRKGLL